MDFTLCVKYVNCEFAGGIWILREPLYAQVANLQAVSGFAISRNAYKCLGMTEVNWAHTASGVAEGAGFRCAGSPI